MQHTPRFGLSLEMTATTGTDIREAASLLKAGRLVAFPTETVYGLGADALDAAAVARVFEAKNRPEFDPLIAANSPHAPSEAIARPPRSQPRQA